MLVIVGAAIVIASVLGGFLPVSTAITIQESFSAIICGS